MNVLVKLAPVALATLLTACASPSPAPVLLTLPSATAPVPDANVSPASSAASAPLLVVRRVSIPEYMVSRRVRYRADPSTLAEWPNTYWAERIEIGVSREFNAALRQQLPGWSLCDTNCGDQSPSMTLHVELVRMDYLRNEGLMRAPARITLSGAGPSAQVLTAQEINFVIPGGASPQAQAEATSVLIRQLAAAAGTLVRAARP